MLSHFAQIDEFLVDRLIRPFYYLGLSFAGLILLSGWFIGLVTLIRTPLGGILILAIATALAGLIFVGTRIAVESVIAVFRMHKRFVGGGPKDEVPQ